MARHTVSVDLPFSKSGIWRGPDGEQSRTYRAWKSMRQRCLNPNCHAYRNYGGRGIQVCERWVSSFANFLADMGECPVGLSLDRTNNDGNYEPGNCRWTTCEVQLNNTRCNKRLTHEGVTLTLNQWSRRLGIGSVTITHRLNSGFSIADALKPKDFRNTQQISFGEIADTADGWAKRLGFKDGSVIRNRLRRGMSIEQALTLPVGNCRGWRS